MTRNPNNADEEIDLFVLFWSLWAERKVLVFVTALSMIVGLLPLLRHDPFQQAKVYLDMDLIPPFTNATKVRSEFGILFNSPDVFSEWKLNDTSEYLTFDMIDETNLVADFNYAVEPGLRAIRQRTGYLLIKTDNPDIFFGLEGYASFVNFKLTQSYQKEAKFRVEERRRLLDGYPKLYNNGSINLILEDPFVFSLEGLQQYLRAGSTGRQTLKISRPVLVQKTEISIYTRLTILGIAGFGIGVLLVLLRHLYRSSSTRIGK